MMLNGVYQLCIQPLHGKCNDRKDNKDCRGQMQLIISVSLIKHKGLKKTNDASNKKQANS